MNKVKLLLKLVFSYLLYLIIGSHDKRKIALICEKTDEARDNGFYFFNYCMKVKNKKNIEFFYLIKKNSKDYEKIKKYNNNIIYIDTVKHYYYYFCSSYMISSQSFPYPISKKLCIKFLKCRNKKTCWLQHGVTKDYDIAMDYKFSNNLSFLCCVSEKEQKIFTDELNYPKSVAVKTGFCRFDGLKDISNINSPQILIMPTFRKWLTPMNYDKPTVQEMDDFQNSAYYKFYNGLLESKELNELLVKYNAKIIFYLHYAFQPYAELFKDTEKVIIARKNDYDVQLLMKESNYLVTDFSSVAFDFAYMNKPLCYAHFDYEEYRSKHYGEGSYSYRNDGFGPVVTSIEDTIKSIKQAFSSKFNVQPVYKDRVDNFFEKKDTRNCERVFNSFFD